MDVEKLTNGEDVDLCMELRGRGQQQFLQPPQGRRVLQRTVTLNSIHSETVAASKSPSNEKHDLLPFGGGREYPPILPQKEDYLVDFEGHDDPIHPINWPMRRKIVVCTILGYMTLVSTWGSSIFTSATVEFARQFGVSLEVGLLALTFFVLGFAFGPIVFAPYSELYGRKQPLLVAGFLSAVFQIAVATAANVQTVLICRFFAGVFASAPLAVVGAAFSDCFTNETRGTAVAVFACCVFAGPMIAPIVGGFLVVAQPVTGWRWTEYITAIIGFVSTALVLFFYEETYAPTILVYKARKLRRLTGNWGIHAKQEEVELSFRDLMVKNLGRPLNMLIKEPIILFLSIYSAFVYGMLYLVLTAYPVVYQQIRHFENGYSALPFLAIVVGEFIGSMIVIAFEPWYNRRVAAHGGRPVPEARLPPLIIGSVIFPAGLFWFAWTGGAAVHWIVPTISGILIGAGLITIFLQIINYLIDAFLMFAASAIAANTVLRSLAGAAFPLFGSQMFANLGVEWAGSLLGFIGVAMIPIPILFYIYGERIRMLSKRAPS